MANLNPIPVGNSSRITTLLNTTTDRFVFKNKSVSSNVIQNTSRGPLMNFNVSGENNNSSIQQVFNKNHKTLYKKISPYTEAHGLLGFGPDQPYISLTPDSPTKNIKKYDSRVFPIGSTIQDTIRIAKWSVSGKGLLFYGKQFLLQAQAAHNETGIYNPLSVLQSTIRPASFGLIPRSKRHIDTGGGLLAGMLSSMGIKDNSGEPPKGTAGAKDRSTLPDTGQNDGKGNIRAKTGATARQRLVKAYGGSTKKSKGGFLSNLVSKLFPAFGAQPDQFKGVGGEKKYRADQDAYDLMLKFHELNAAKHPLFYGNSYSTKYYNESINQNATKLAGAKFEGIVYPAAMEFGENNGRNDASLIEQAYTELMNKTFVRRYAGFARSPLNDKFSFIQMGAGGKREPITNNKELHQSHTTKLLNKNIKHTSVARTATKYSELDRKALGENEKYIDIVKSIEYQNMLTTSDYFNEDGPDGKKVEVFTGKGFDTPNGDAVNFSDISDKEPHNTSDQIPFWFYDMVNKKYIQFRATVTGIADNDSADWEEIKYLGKPDSVFNYKGYSRTLSFGFTVAVTSIRELYPTWRKLNYLKSMSRPSDYSGGDGDTVYKTGKFMVPPLVQLRIGDMYKNVPIAMSSINITIADDATWETLPDSEGDYKYFTTVVPNVRWGQYPTRVDVSITAHVLERENYPRIGNTIFGGDQSDISSKFILRSVVDRNRDNKIVFGQYYPPTVDAAPPVPTSTEMTKMKLSNEFGLSKPLENNSVSAFSTQQEDVPLATGFGN